MAQPPTLLFIIGPPAVGKMTVGFEIATRTGLKVLHNHMTIEPVIRIFAFRTPEFMRLVGGFRQQIVEEVARSDLPGLIFTYVWAFDLEGEAEGVARIAKPFEERGGRVLYLELEASQEVRLERNETELRLAEKPSKRDLELSRRLVLDDDARHRLNSTTEFEGVRDYLRIDNSALSAAEVAEVTIDHFGLTRVGSTP